MNMRWFTPRVRLIIGIVLGVLALAIIVDVATARPELCASCHEIEPRAESWEQSAHSAVVCVECHQPPTAWYQLPKRLFDRGQLLIRDTAVHLSGDYEDPVDSRVPGSDPVADEVCLQCHDPNRKATSGFRILIEHAEHAERNGSCISCHVRTAHPIETRGTALSLMAQCYTCHGTGPNAKAPADCGLCHPADYELLPASHTEATWKREHGETATSDARQCVMCHEKSFCTDCHGVEMPHPDGWEQGATGHAAAAEADREVCTQCHGTSPDMCTMCHHQGYDPGKGTWVKQHYIEVRNRGVTYCFDCHSPLFCIRCHVQ